MTQAVVEFREAYSPSTNLHLYAIAWDECIELQVSDKHTWFERLALNMTSVPRWEIVILQNEFALGGLICAVDENDVHVGRCLAVISQYVVPEYRNTGVSLRCMREAIRLAKRLGLPVLAYTHRTGPWRYETIYRKIP